MRIIGNDPSVPRQTQEVASGTLPNGKPVVVNADGTVSVVSSTDQALGSAVVFESGTMQKIASAFDSNSNKIVIAYRDGGNSSYGTAIVGTISGSSVSFGTAVVFASAATNDVSSDFDSTANKVLITHNIASSGGGKTIVGTVSGTSISFGGGVVIDGSLTTTIQNTATVYDPDNNKTVVIVKDGGNGDKGFAYVGTVSGTSISFGSQVIMSSSSIGNSLVAVYDTNSNKVVVGYKDAQVVVGTVSGTSISFGSIARFTTNTQIGFGMTFDSANNKIVAAIGDYTDSTGKAFVGTVSGTSISFGSGVTFNAGETIDIAATFDPDAGKVVIAYRDSGNSNYGTVITGTVSGTSISFDSETVYESARAEYNSIVYDSNANKSLISYMDQANSSYGTSIVFTTGSQNITSENYIGMSSGPASPAVTGTKTAFDSNAIDSEITGSVFDPDTGKIIISYSRNSDGHGLAVVGTVSGTTLSFGTPVVFNAGEVEHTAITYDTTNNKVVIVYRDSGNNDYGTAIVGTVSGTSISFGTEVVFESAITVETSVVFDSNAGKVVIAYQDATDNNRGTAIVGTVSGTSISFGSAVQFETGIASDIVAVFDSSNNKVVISYRLLHSNPGKSVVGTVSGTSISFGSAVTFYSGAQSDTNSTFDSTNNKVIISFKAGDDNDYAKAVVGTVSGTSISFGSVATINSAASQTPKPIYNTVQQKLVFEYRLSGNGVYYRTATVSGTGLANISDQVTLASGFNALVSTLVYHPTEDVTVVAFKDAGDSNKGNAIAFTLESRGEVADGGHALIDTQGAISDNQGGLTAGQSYFVQNDGTIGTTAADPSVFAGTAVSATKLIVKG